MEKDIHESLTDELSKAEEKLKSLVEENHDSFIADTKSLKEIETELQRLCDGTKNVSSRLKNTSDNDLEDGVIKLTEEFSEKTIQLRTIAEEISLVEILVKWHRNSQIIEERLANGKYSEVVADLAYINQLCNDLTNLLQEKISENTPFPRILGLMQNEHSARRIELRKRLEELFLQAVNWDNGDLSISSVVDDKHSTQHCQHRFHDVLDYLRSAGMLESKMRVFAQKLVDSIVIPIMTELNATLYMSKLEARVPVVVRIACIVPHEADSPSKERNSPSPTSITECRVASSSLSKISDLLEFLRLNVVDNDIYAKPLGSELWPLIQAVVLQRCLIPMLPATVEELVAYKQDFLQKSIDCESRAIELGLAPEHDVDRTVSRFAHDLPENFAYKAQQVFLDRVRSALKSKNIAVAVTVGGDTPLLGRPYNVESSDISKILSELTSKCSENLNDGGNELLKDLLDLPPELSRSAFSFPKCRASGTAVDVVRTVADVIDETVKWTRSDLGGGSTTEVACDLIRISRNILDMYLATAPLKLRLERIRCEAGLQEQQHSLREAVLLHNDFYYVGHACLTMGIDRSKELPEAVGSTVRFLDMVVPFRNTANSILQSHVSAVVKCLHEIIENAGGLADALVPARNRSIQTAINRIEDYIESVHAAWGDILSSAQYASAAAELADGLLKDISRSVLAIEDISEEESFALRDILNRCLDLCDEHAYNIVRPAQDQLAVNDFKTEFVVRQRAVEIRDILELGLRAIMSKYSDLTEMQLSSQEVSHLIIALFAESQLRSDALEILQRHDDRNSLI